MLRRESRLTWGVALAATFVAVVSVLALDSSLKLQEDSGIYITLAQSLSGGHGYRDLFLTDAPPHVKFPPIFPLLLAPVVHLRGFDFMAMKLMLTAVALAALLLVGALFREIGDGDVAALVVLLTATSPAIVYYTQSIMTEGPYLLLSLLAMVWIERCARRGGWTRGGVAVAAVLLSLVCLTRVVGIALVLATVLYIALDGKGKSAARMRAAVGLGALAAVPVGLWLLYSSWASQGSGIPYLRYYQGSLEPVASASSGTDAAVVLLGKVRAALLAYGVHVGRLIVYWVPPSLAGNGLALGLAATAVAGFLHCAVRRRTVVEYYVFLYVSALLVFPGSRRQRYMVPLIPFVWFYVLVALQQVLSRLRPDPGRARWAGLAGRAVLIGLLLLNATTSVLVNIARGGRGYYESATPDRFAEARAWVRANTPADSVFMWSKPSLGYVLAGRRAVEIPESGPEVVLAVLQERDVSYILADPILGFLDWERAQALNRFIALYPERLTLVHQDGSVSVYRVVKPA